LNKNRKLLAALVLPIVILLGGAGVSLVVAAEKPYSPPSGDDAFAAAPASLVLAGASGPAGVSSSRAARSKASVLKRKCRKKKPAAKRNCLKRVQALLKPKYMPLKRAENIALVAAERAWASDVGEYEWTDYGLADCRRLARNSVSCAVYVYYEQSQYGYDDYGAIYDCEWVVNSKYLSGGGLKVSGSFANRQCEWL
jgi:hypothetical protein